MKKIEAKDTSLYTKKILSPPNESDKIFPNYDYILYPNLQRLEQNYSSLAMPFLISRINFWKSKIRSGY